MQYPSPDFNFNLRPGYKSPRSYTPKTPKFKRFKTSEMSQRRMSTDAPNAFPQIRGGIRKTKYRSNPAIMRRQLARMSKIHNFKRTYNFGTDSTNAVSDTLEAYNFSLNDMPGYTEFTALYDFYKVNRVKFKLIPYQTESNSVTSLNNAAHVPIFYCVDTSDATAPTSVNEVCEYNDHKIANLYRGFTCYFKPKFADSTSAPRDGWVATSSPSTNWYGLKLAIPPTAYSMTFYVIWTVYISCKDPK